MRKDSVTKELKPIVDLRPAEKFGQLAAVFDHDMDPSHPTDIRNAELRLEDFDPEQDYILPNGSPIATLATGIILGKKNVKEVQTLIWDKIFMKYQVGVVEL
jgi:hypothetical protein